MKRVAAVLFCGLWLLAAGRASALQFGDIEVGSLRGEPLLARVALSDLPENAEQELAVGLADASDFSRAGLAYPSHLDSLQFRLVSEGDEPAHVMIAGRDPVDAPFISLLIEGVWSGGRVLREYTIVLDAMPARTPGTYGPVRAVDTLWSLASRFRPEGTSVQRMMLAMLALNPHAFTVENVNALRAGTVLEIPASDRIGVDDKSSAMDEVRRQNDAWQVHLRSPVAGDAVAESAAGPAAVAEETVAAVQPVTGEETGVAESSEDAPGPELRVVVPGTEETTSTEDERKLRAELDLALEEVDSRRLQLTEMNARLDEAERLIVDLQRLVELKDDDIADLQRRLSDEADAAAQARRDASAQAQAAARAQAEAQALAEAADAARRQAEIEAEAAALAREEARVQAEAERRARAELELAQSGTAAGGQGLDGQEDSEALGAATDAGIIETVPLDEEGEPGTENGSAPSLLATLEGLLGFSPVVGGVGLVGLILILGGLIALMRRRASSPEDAAEDDFASQDDEDSDLWEDDSLLDEESAGARSGDTSAPEASRGSKSALRPADDELDVDHFDIGIDLDDELARSLDEEPDTEPRLARESKARERALSSPRDGDGGRLPAGSAVDSASMASRGRAAGAGEDSSRGFEDSSLSDLIEPAPALDDGRGGTHQGAWPDRGATEPARGVRDAGAGEYGAALGPGREARDESRAGLGGEESLASDIDELQTKLDLAQTYIDMEDYDDARALLREVQAEGDLEQRAIARYLAGKIP